MIYKGLISMVNAASNTAEVILPEFDDAVTPEIPFYTPGAASTATIGQFVAVLSFSDNLADSVILSTGQSSGTPQIKIYSAAFTSAEFTVNGTGYQLVIPCVRHNTGYNSRIQKFERKNASGDYGNVIYQYRQLVNGDILFTVDEVFDGRFIIEGEMQ